MMQDFESWYNANAKYMDPADLKAWCQEAWKAAPSVPEAELWDLRDAILDALFRRAVPHTWESLVSEAAFQFITKRRESLAAAAPAAQAPSDAKDAQRVWIARNEDGEEVMFFTQIPGRELKDRYKLTEYLCYPVAAMQDNGKGGE